MIETDNYLNLPSWDGCVNFQDLAVGSHFAAVNAKHGPVLIHCAHGVGRSVTHMRAALVEADLAMDVDDAFTKIKMKRPVAKSSKDNQFMLEKWQKSRN